MQFHPVPVAVEGPSAKFPLGRVRIDSDPKLKRTFFAVFDCHVDPTADTYPPDDVASVHTSYTTE